MGTGAIGKPRGAGVTLSESDPAWPATYELRRRIVGALGDAKTDVVSAILARVDHRT